MINLNSNNYQYQKPSGDMMGIMSSTMPQQNNNFTLPNNQRSPFAGFDDAKWRDIQAKTEAAGRRATLQEYQSAGGNANDYHKIYGGLANGGYDTLRSQYEVNGGKIPYQAWVEAGGNPNEYGKIYGDQFPTNPQNPYENIFNQQLQGNYTQAGIDAQLNRINEQNPYGSSQYITNPDGSVSRVSNLSAPNQQLLDQQYYQDISRNNAIGGMLNSYAQSYNPISQDYTGEANRVENETYNKLAGDINKQGDRDYERLRTQLLNSGNAIGSERYTRAMEDYQRNKSDSLANARLNAMSAGRDQGNYLLNQELQRRNQPLSEMSAIQSQVRGVQQPSFSQNYNVQMPYLDTATPSIDYANTTRGFAREDYLRALAEAQAKKGGGGGRSGGGSSRAQSSYDQQMLNFIMGTVGNQNNAPSPFLTGLTATAPLLGSALGSYLGS